MARYNKFNTYELHKHHGVHNFTSDSTCTITVALTNAANPPVATNSVLADLVQISYTNLSSRVVSVTSSSQTDGIYSLVLQDLTLTASGAVPTFRYVVLYNDDTSSPTDALIGWLDAGGDVVMNSGDSFLIDFSSTGLFNTM